MTVEEIRTGIESRGTVIGTNNLRVLLSVHEYPTTETREHTP
ncbi:hypothetical protein HanRHA438_Chr17g0802441 [Helianthus annuus]|nr:hypothetical protein HanRHA438_Chr17g0802441 [Helianthus annuus]